MSIRTLEQKRASHAYGAISQLPEDRKTKEYRSQVLRLPAMVQSCGLLQAVGFYNLKSKEKEQEPICDKLQDWLLGDDVSLPWQPDQKNARDLFKSLGEIDVGSYRMVTREALAYLKWLKRAAEILLPK